MSRLAVSLNLERKDFDIDVEFDIKSNGVTAITGASGSGKTTILRCIAGLEKNAKGVVNFNGKSWLDTANNMFIQANKRSVGYIFQEAALFPNMNVMQNLKYALKRKGDGENIFTFEDIVEKTGLTKLKERNIKNLSGGEKQRVAIARALISNPEILLMDEPVSALDKQSRYQILEVIETIKNLHNIPIIYVSHAIEEISRLADRVVCIDNGKVKNIGNTDEILTAFDSEFSHEDNAHSVIKGKVVDYDLDYELARVEFSGGTIFLPTKNTETNKNISLQVYASNVSISLKKPSNTSILNVVKSTIIDICEKQRDKGQYIIKLDAEGTILLSHITKKSLDTLKLKKNIDIYAQIKSVSIIGY